MSSQPATSFAMILLSLATTILWLFLSLQWQSAQLFSYMHPPSPSCWRPLVVSGLRNPCNWPLQGNGDKIINANKNDAKLALEQFQRKFNELSDEHIPLRKITSKQLSSFFRFVYMTLLCLVYSFAVHQPAVLTDRVDFTFVPVNRYRVIPLVFFLV